MTNKRYIYVRKERDMFRVVDTDNIRNEVRIDLGLLMYLIGKDDIDPMGENFDSYTEDLNKLLYTKLRIIAIVKDGSDTFGYATVDSDGNSYILSTEQTLFMIGHGNIKGFTISTWQGRSIVRSNGDLKMSELPKFNLPDIDSEAIQIEESIHTTPKTYFKGLDIYHRSKERKGCILIAGNMVEIKRETFGYLLYKGVISTKTNSLTRFKIDSICTNKIKREYLFKSRNMRKIGYQEYECVYVVKSIKTGEEYDISRESIGYLIAKGCIRNVYIEKEGKISDGKITELDFGVVNKYSLRVNLGRHNEIYSDDLVCALPMEKCDKHNVPISVYGKRVYVKRATFGVYLALGVLEDCVEERTYNISDIYYDTEFENEYSIVGRVNMPGTNEYRYVLVKDKFDRSDKLREILVTEESLGLLIKGNIVSNAAIDNYNDLINSMEIGSTLLKRVEEAVIKINIHGKEIVI